MFNQELMTVKNNIIYLGKYLNILHSYPCIIMHYNALYLLNIMYNLINIILLLCTINHCKTQFI